MTRPRYALAALAAFTLTMYLPTEAKWIWDKSANTITADGTGLTPEGTSLKVDTTASSWGRGIANGQVQVSKGQTTTEAVIDLTEAIETAEGTSHTLEAIADQAFNSKTTLTKCLLPDTVKWIGQQAFNNCTSLEDIRAIPAQIYQMGGGAFNGCKKLSVEVKFPETFRGTTWNTFDNTLAYGDVVWPAQAGDVQIQDFENTKITSFTIAPGANCKKIRKMAFKGCTELTRVTLNEGLTQLGEDGAGDGNVFNGCTKLPSVEIPSTVTSIGHNTFQDTKAFTGEFVWPSQVPILPANCFNGSAISLFVAKTGLKEVREGVFKNCANLKTVVLPDTLETMNKESWANGVVGLTVYWRACPANALSGGLYSDWGSGRNRTHYLSATPENVEAWTAFAASSAVNDGTNYKTFVLPALKANGAPDYDAVGVAGQEGGKIYWWKDPDLLPKPLAIFVR